jgi:hypothetical protein
MESPENDERQESLRFVSTRAHKFSPPTQPSPREEKLLKIDSAKAAM